MIYSTDLMHRKKAVLNFPTVFYTLQIYNHLFICHKSVLVKSLEKSPDVRDNAFCRFQ